MGGDFAAALNKIEPLGSIFLEAFDYGLPPLGFASGGIGEIACCLGLTDLTIKPETSDWEPQLLENCMILYSHWNKPLYAKCYENLVRHFSPQAYTNSIEQIFQQ